MFVTKFANFQRECSTDYWPYGWTVKETFRELSLFRQELVEAAPGK
jgi:hypothetical protein